MELKPVYTTEAPLPAGHYSQAIIFNGLIYVSGQLPIVPETNKLITGRIEDQALQILSNIRAILIAAGSDISKIIKVTIFISDISMWSDVNKIYSEFFGIHKPARSVVPVNKLHHGSEIEMEVIAAQ